MSGTTETDGDDLREVLGMATRRAPPRLAIGQVIDDAYRIDGELGEGGMGRVYLAHDLRLGRDVALKLHAGARAADDDTLRREAAALARLSHPNVVTVYEVGAWHGHHWVAMEYVPAGTARAWLAAARRTPREVIALYVAAGRGLAAAHAAGLVHRDFKPDNVLVGEDGRPRVADFGLARATDDAELAEGGRGTPGYMAPEQRAGEAVRPAADQYAFAITLWEALAGERPEEPPRAPRAGAVPKHVEAALRRALAPAPDARWPGLPPLLAELARDPARARRRVAAAAAAGLALAAGGFAVSRALHGGAAEVACEVDELAEWSPARAAALRSELAGAADHVVGAIDTWTMDWRGQRRDACEAGHGAHAQPTAIVDLRTACLDRARAELAAALDVLPATGPNAAVELIATLPRLRACADVAELTGGARSETAPSAIAEVAAATALTARARALRVGGRSTAALGAAEQAVAYADAIGLPAERARARIELGAARIGNGRLPGTVELLEEAARLAGEAKDDALVVVAWFAVLDAIGVRHEWPGEADHLLVVAETAVARAGETPRRRAELQKIRGDLMVANERYADALPLLVGAAKLQEQSDGPDEPDLARVYNRIATVLTNLHRGTEARGYLDRAAQLIERTFGPNHPNLGVVLTTRAALEVDLGDLDTAIEDLGRALRIKEGAEGRDHATLAPTLFNLAIALSSAGRNEEALAYARRGLAISERTLPANHPRLALAFSTVGSMEYYAQDYDAAARDLERSRDILGPDGGTTLAQTYRMLADIALKRNDVRSALADSARSVVLGGDTLEGARARATRGWALQAAGDRAGARRAMQDAYDLAVKLAGDGSPDAIRIGVQLETLP